MATITERLAAIQKTINVPKGRYNEFGKFKYRNCEDILEAVKPLLNGLVLTINDDVCLVGDHRFYIKATATISDGESSLSASAFAREPEGKKGMDDSQVTGTASSYARKTALSGLLGLDDASSDPDEQKAPVGSGKRATQDAFSAMDAEEQKFLSELATQVRADMAENNIAKAIPRLRTLDADEKAAIWSLFDSKERSAIKKAEQEARASAAVDKAVEMAGAL